MRFITVSELKKKLAHLDDSAIIVVPSRDHSYREIGSISETTAQWTDGYLGEFDEEYGLDEPHSALQKVVVFQ